MENKKKDKVLKAVGLLGLFLVVLGISYALFRITLTGRKKTRIKTANFNIELLDKNNNSIVKNSNNQYEYEINIDNAVPISDEEGSSQEGFIFKLRNSGNIGAKYTIYLDDVELQSGENRLSDQYIKYSLTKNESAGSPSLLSTLDNRKLDTGIINSDATDTYTLKVWVDEGAGIEASNKVFESVIRVEAEQYIIKMNIQSGTFADTLQKQGIVASITKTEGEVLSESWQAEQDGLYDYTDSKGTKTYVYRGINIDNYVAFAGTTWRVLRIQEDGTVKLIKEDALNFDSDKVSRSEDNYKNVKYNNSSSLDDDSKYVGSNVKAYVEEWYNSEMTSYDSKIVTNTYCSDRTEDHNSLAFKVLGDFSKLYGVYNSFKMGDWDGESEPTEAQSAATSFTPSISCRNEDEVNVKVAMITADEAVLAGAGFGESSAYLENDYDWWTMSPVSFDEEDAYSYVFRLNGKLVDYKVDSALTVRPVITLKSNVTVTSGNGTAETPYIIQ